MAQKDVLGDELASTVKVTVQYSDGSRLEAECTMGHVIAYGVTQNIMQAATTVTLYRADGTEQMTI